MRRVSSMNKGVSMYYIYTLNDPRTDEVRYVGKTCNPEQRRKQHLPPAYNTSEEKRLWLLELRALGFQPLMVIVEQVEDAKDASWRETYWRHHFMEAGARLTNSICVAQRHWTKAVERCRQESNMS